ncbi:PucR family transcriptional regulator [Nocardia sp. NPDC058058]|uniref:PucR family transcriptional regulator n=1 Tax=Nocardia sp. NPDC058058 TaxID=3346317 RepID=UPI0036DBCC85
MTIAPPRLAAHAPIVARLIPRIPEIALEVRDVCVDAMPVHAAATEGYFAADVRPAIYACCTGYLRALEESRSISREEIARILIPVGERHAAGNRIGLSLLMSALHSGAGHLWSLVAAAAEPADAADLAAFTEHLFAYTGEVSSVLAETYIDSEQLTYSGDVLARRALCAALLKGDPVDDLAVRADITPADRYHVVALHIRSIDGLSGPGAQLGARRRLRLAQQAFDHFAGGPVLNTFDGTAGIVLFAADTLDADQSGDAVEQLISMLERRFHVDTHAALCRDIGRAELAAAGDSCRQVAELAQLLGRPAGLYHPDDFLLEQQITRPGPARERIAALLIPLREHPHLIETLEMHVQYGGADRKAAADKMFIHPNTFSYRLRRVAELTGVDPLQPNGFRLHAAAVVIHRIDRAKFRIGAEAAPE